MDWIPSWLVGAWLVLIGLNHLRVRRDMVRTHPPVTYVPATGPGVWRWGAPPAGTALLVAHHEGRSRVTLPTRRRLVSVVGPAFGVLFLFGAAALLVHAAFGDPPLFLPPLLTVGFPVIPAAIGLGALYADNHVVAVDLTPKDVAVTVSYGFFLVHRVRVSRGRLAAPEQVVGTVQSGLAMATTQEQPDYQLRLRGRGLLHRDRLFVLHVDPTDGAWIADGLRCWATLLPHPGGGDQLAPGKELQP